MIPVFKLELLIRNGKVWIMKQLHMHPRQAFLIFLRKPITSDIIELVIYFRTTFLEIVKQAQLIKFLKGK